MSKYTEGPWVKDYGKTLGHIKSVPEKGEGLCRTPTVARYDIEVIPNDEATANANLIAQAPAMHKELEKILTGLIDCPAIQKILDKVEGEV